MSPTTTTHHLSSDPPTTISQSAKHSSKIRIILNTKKAPPPPTKRVKIILKTKGLFSFPPKAEEASKKRKERPSEEELDEEGVADEISWVHTRSQNPALAGELAPRKNKRRRPKVYPSNTPWGWDWKFERLNDFHPGDGTWTWEGSEIPEFELGEPLDEMNFWEGGLGEERKAVRERRKERARKGFGRKRAFKRCGEQRREKGRFVREEQVRGEKWLGLE